MTDNETIYTYTYTSPNASYPPILLVHGAGANHLIWPPEIRRLSGYEVHAVDLPGHGKSGGPGKQSIEENARLIYEWMQSKQIHRAFFIGHSMGAAITLHMALNYPNQVCGMALLGAAAKFNIGSDLVEQSSTESGIQLAIEKFVRMGFHQNVRKDLVNLINKRMKDIRPSVFHGDLLATSDFNISNDLEKITQPTLVLVGKEDQLTPLRNAQYLATKIKQTTLEVVQDAGHLVMIEQPAISGELLKKFIDENIWKMS
jgi:pimeloyl-ACP methyl ester carboxylesterase